MDLSTLQEAIINGNRKKAEEITRAALESGVSPAAIITDGLILGMQEVGRRFKANEYYVPEVLVAARAMQQCMNIVKPMLSAAERKSPVTVGIGTVAGDLHDIGKNLVMMMLEGAGFEIVDLGVDVSPEKFVEAVKEKGVNVLCMSALLTTTMPSMKSTIDALVAEGVRSEVKVMIGGAPVTQEYSDQIGADGYSEDAASAVDKLKELVGIA